MEATDERAAVRHEEVSQNSLPGVMLSSLATRGLTVHPVRCAAAAPQRVRLHRNALPMMRGGVWGGGAVAPSFQDALDSAGSQMKGAGSFVGFQGAATAVRQQRKRW